MGALLGRGGDGSDVRRKIFSNDAGHVVFLDFEAPVENDVHGFVKDGIGEGGNYVKVEQLQVQGRFATGVKVLFAMRVSTSFSMAAFHSCASGACIAALKVLGSVIIEFGGRQRTTRWSRHGRRRGSTRCSEVVLEELQTGWFHSRLRGTGDS